MPKKGWTSKEKLQVVLDGVKGMTVPEICREHGIAQSMYYSSYLHSSLGYLPPCTFELQEMERVAKAGKDCTADRRS